MRAATEAAPLPWQRQTADAPLRLLVLLCGWAGGDRGDDQSARITSVARDVRDWPRFVELVGQHRVAGLVHAALGAAGTPVPARVREDIAAQALRIARRNLIAAAEVVRLQNSLEQAGIDAVFFKGITIADRAYGNIAVKQSKDIDFLVPSDRIGHVVALLEKNGYRFFTPHPPAHSPHWQSLLRFLIEVEMVHPETRIQVEPHWSLDQANILPVDAMRARSGKQHCIVSGVRIRTFHPDDHFAYLCLHGAKTGWHRLKWLADLHALTRSESEDELRRLVDHAGRIGVEGCAVIAFALCHRVFGMSVPHDILRRADARWATRRLIAFSLANLGRSERRTHQLSPIGALLLAAVQGYPLREMFGWWTSHADVRQFPFPRGLYWLYPAIRIPSVAIRRLRAHLLPARRSAGRRPPGLPRR